MNNNHAKFTKLRNLFPEFIFEDLSVSFDGNVINIDYTFSAGNRHVFRPGLRFHMPSIDPIVCNDPMINYLAFHIGMVEMISYWKAFCPPHIIIKPYRLDQKQQAWFKKLFYHGLGEFFYTNGIEVDISDMFAFSSDNQQAATPPPISAYRNAERAAIVAVGGGKDSVVSLDILTKYKHKVYPLVVNSREATHRVIHNTTLPALHPILIERRLDPLLLSLNEEGALNGHTPFSALLAFITTFAAHTANITDIALSNESSANEPTIPGTSINHQYSKSFEFEQDFREYIQQYLSKQINYFSFLRPLNELQISALFSQMTSYHHAFRSCNAGSKTDEWCRKCPKCLFTYIMLSPFIIPKELTTIYGGNLLKNSALIPLLDQLTGVAENKPFECVGTVKEVNAAMAYLLHSNSCSEANWPDLLVHYEKTVKNRPNKELLFTLLASFDRSNNLNPYYEGILKEHLSQLKTNAVCR